jgi:hypothetical protein
MQDRRGKGGFTSIVRTCGRSVVVLAGVAALLAAAPAASADSTIRLPTHAWQKVAPNALNVAFPDENTVYYFVPYLAKGELKTVVEGHAPSARFWSHTIYQTQGGALDNLPGDAISTEPDGGYRITIAESCAGVEGNCLSTTAVPRPTPSVQGALVYRLYVPADIASTQTGGVPVPRASYVASGDQAEADLSTADLPAAAELRDQVVSLGATKLQSLTEQPTPLSGPVPAPDNDPPVRSFRFRGHQGTAIDFLLTKGLLTEQLWAQLNATLPNPSGQGGPFSTPSNEYAYIFYQHERGNLVVRAKAPTYRAQFPDPANSLGRSDGSEQVRYWSVCTNSALTRYVDCLRDEDIAIPEGEDEFEVAVSPSCPVPGYANCLLAGNEGIEFAVVYRNQYASPSFAGEQLSGEWTYRGEYVAR